jgi:hypothetical protein
MITRHPFIADPVAYLTALGFSRADAIAWIRALVHATRQARTPRTAGHPELTEAVVSHQKERSRRRQLATAADLLTRPFAQRCRSALAELERRREDARREHIEATHARTANAAAALGVTPAQLISCAKRAGIKHEALEYDGRRGGYVQYFWSSNAVKSLQKLDTIEAARNSNIVRGVMES